MVQLNHLYSSLWSPWHRTIKWLSRLTDAGAQEIAQAVHCMPCKHEGITLIFRTHAKKLADGNVIQHQKGRARKILGDFWSANLSFLVYSKLARDPATKNDRYLRESSSVFCDLHAHMYTCSNILKNKECSL